MKKTLSLLVALLLVALMSTAAMAASDNGKAEVAPGKKILHSQKQQSPGQLKKEDKKAQKEEKKVQKEEKKVQKQEKKAQKAEKHIKERIKKSVREQYRLCKEKPDKAKDARFNDTYQHWAKQYIEDMAAVGLLKGYPDGSFKPDQKLSQAEALSLVMRIAADAADVIIIDEDEDKDELDKIPAWVRGDADKACKKGIIKLNRFHSAMQASRAQVAVMIAKALGLEPVDTSNLPFKDGLLISKEDLGYIIALYEEGIISGSPNGNFNPNSAITRAEMASILQRLLDLIEDENKGEIVSVTLPQTATVESGKSITLEAVVKYSDGSTDSNVKWSCSDTTLATVEDGTITAAADKTGTVTITASATRGDYTKSATCTVTIVEKIPATAAALKETGNVGSHDGKVYQEYRLEVDDQPISLAKDEVKSITLQKEGADAVSLAPDTDSTLWFNVQRETGEYTLTVVDNDDKTYEAVIDWAAPIEIAAIATGNSGKHDGSNYVEFKLGALDLSSFTKMYQIKPDGQVAELTPNSDNNLWFKTTNQIAGKHVFLIKKADIWYTASITL
jgi:flagellar motor protein MotB